MKFNTMLRSEVNACGQVLGWWFEISDAETYKTLYKSDAYYKPEEAKEAMNIVLKNLSNEEWLKWKTNSDGTAWSGNADGGIRQLIIKNAVICREETNGQRIDKIWKIFDTEEECRQFIRDFIEERLAFKEA